MATTPTPTSTDQQPRQRVSAAERRDALIEAAIHEFAHGGLHGTPVERIARRVGVAQPYVFSLFASKRELFLAAVERDFQLTEDTFTRAAAALDPASASPDDDVLHAMGKAYVELLGSNRDYLMLQHQAYAACDEPEIRERVRTCYARLVAHVVDLSGAEPARIDEFISQGMWLNVAAAMEVDELSPSGQWARAQLDGSSNQLAR
ncbi:MAG TPA: TetR/AcrR family transcriptional regulator [Solirubrobacteraceae bacterium]|jgi:AcrR family transcriptional regulator|nr:TetR/AcrR family transcriptional regulator [Solirubrobacteraceae bacterium]